MSEALQIACGRVACFDAATGLALREIVIAPDGHVQSTHGEFVVDAEGASMAISAFAAHETDLPVDYEHQTLGGDYAAPDGKAPAAGWIKALRYQPERGLIANVEWTDRGRDMIAAKEYRYLSPVAAVRKTDSKLVAIHSVALTNKPAIRAMEPLVATNRTAPGTEKHVMADEPAGTTTGGDPSLLIGKIMEALGVEAEGDDLMASLNAIYEAVKKKDGGDGGEGDAGGDTEKVASKAVLTALGVKEDATEAEIVVAINGHKKGGEGLTAMKAELDAVVNKLAERDADDLVKPHIESGRINPKDAEDLKVCRDLALSDPKAFEHQMKHRQPDPPPGRTTPPGGGAGDSSRETIIAKAASDVDGDPNLQALTCKAAYAGEALRKAGLSPLTDEERKTLVA